MNSRLMIISLNSDPILEYGTEHNGGQSKYVLELGKNLVKEGWDIDVFTIKNSKSEDVAQITEGFNVYRFPLPENHDYYYSMKESDIILIANSIVDFINKNKYEYNVVLCCYWLSGIIGLELKKIFSLKTLITFCSLGYFKDTTKSNHFRIKKEKYIAKNIDHIIATSYEEKSILIDFYKAPSDKIMIIPRGVDTNKFKKLIRVKLLFAGRPVKQKGLADLLAALSLLEKYDWSLTIVGQLPDEIQISEFPLRERLDILGTVPNDMMPHLLNTHDILVVPSHYENFGNIIIEGLACGIAIIAAETGGIKNLINHHYNGLFFEPKNCTQLSSSIKYLFDNPHLIKELGTNALSSSAKYDWKNVIAETSTLLDKFS